MVSRFSVSVRPGIFGKQGPVGLTAVSPHPTRSDACVTGTIDGDLFIWAGNVQIGRVPAHSSSPVTVISVALGGGLVSASLLDAKLAVFGPGMERLRLIDLAGLGLLSTSIQSLHWDHVAERMLVGTHGGEILELSEHDGSSLHLEGALVHSHAKGLAAGLCSHPTKDEFATVGDDATLRIWDSLDRRMTACIRLPTMARAVTYHPSGQYLCVGLGSPEGSERAGYYRPSDARYEPAATERANREGAFVVFNTESWQVVYAARDSRKWITAVRFSPDGNTLAVASADRSVYIYDTHVSTAKGEHEAATASSRKLKSERAAAPEDVNVKVLTAKLPSKSAEAPAGSRLEVLDTQAHEPYTPRTKLDGHTSPVLKIDFTSDSSVIRTASGASGSDIAGTRGTGANELPGSIAAESAAASVQGHYSAGSTSFLPASVSKSVVTSSTKGKELSVDVAETARDAVLRELARGGFESMHWKA